MRIALAHLRGNVVAYLALFVALGGTSYAMTLPKNSVGARQIKKNAVAASELKKNAVRSGEVKDGSLRARDLKEPPLDDSDVRVAEDQSFEPVTLDGDEGLQTVEDVTLTADEVPTDEAVKEPVEYEDILGSGQVVVGNDVDPEGSPVAGGPVEVEFQLLVDGKRANPTAPPIRVTVPDASSAPVPIPLNGVRRLGGERKSHRIELQARLLPGSAPARLGQRSLTVLYHLVPKEET